MLALPLVAMVAIVTGDGTPLRAAASDSAAKQELLYSGDWLELRSAERGWLSVYDHRHERPGWVRPSQVRSFSLDEQAARDLAAVIDFVRDEPGRESLGIGLLALFLKAAPPSAVGAETFDALGAMADRLGRRASSRWAKANDAVLAAQLDVAESYGVHFRKFSDGNRTRVCYDGEAHRRVLALPGSAAAKVRAALALSDPACVDPALAVADKEGLIEWQAGLFDPIDVKEAEPWLAGRLRLRRAAVEAQLAWVRARHSDFARAAKSAETAERELALVDPHQLAEEDVLGYDETAVRVGAIRWASEPAVKSASFEIAAGKPGETCVWRISGKSRIAAHCTYAVVWPSSVRVAPRGDLLVLAQSPLPSWTELVVIRVGRAEVVSPAAIDPELGYVEPAGFSPDGSRLLVAREARMTGPLGEPGTLAPWVARTFQILRADGLTVEKQAGRLDQFPSFRRWAAPDWRSGTLAIR
jgi:hypothetical protein